MATRHTELYIVEPKETTNLVTNPSFELDTTGYTAVGGSSSIARTASYQRRGTWALDITPTSSAESGVYFGTVSLTSGTSYTFSCDILDVAGQTFNLYIRAADGTPTSSSTTWTGDGYWKRKSITWTCTSTENYRLYLTRSSVASTAHFYTDGWQCESGAESTYFDGDFVGFNRLRTDYGWNGTAHASTSWRSAKTRSGGTLLRVRDYAGLVGVIGLGMPPMTNNALPIASGGSFSLNTVSKQREITILLAFSDANGLSGLYAKRAALIDAIKPDNVPTDEPIILRWYLTDTAGIQASETLDLVCKYSGGLEYSATEPESSQILERATVTFTAFDPMFIADGGQGADLGFGTSVSNAAYLLYRTPAGVWTSAGVVNDAILDIKRAPSGRIYVTGAFTSIGGTAANRIAYSDNNGATWSAMGTGLSGTGRCLAIAPDGYPYVGGTFATANGVTVNNIAKWNGSTFVAMSGGASSSVYSAAMDESGNLLIGGDFQTVGTGGGTITVNHIAKWTTASAWAAIGSGPGLPYYHGFATYVTVIPRGSTIYAGVSYEGGGASSNDVYRFDGSTRTATLCPVERPINITFGPDGNLYCVGEDDGSAVLMFAVYAGGSWKEIITESTADAGSLYRVRPGTKSIYVMGDFTELNNVPMPGYVAEYANGTFRPLDINVAGDVWTLEEWPDGTLWIGGFWTTTPITSPAVTASVNGSSKAYPVIRFVGPGTLYQVKNYTTGKAIYFNGLTLQDGETAILDMTPGQISFDSNWRGNIMRYLPGTDFDFYLAAGTNNISCYMTGTSAATKAYMAYRNRYWSIDGAAR